MSVIGLIVIPSQADRPTAGGYFSQDLVAAWREGHEMGVRGKDLRECPYDGRGISSLVRKQAWYEGHAQGERDALS